MMLSTSKSIPATHDKAGFEALEWTNEDRIMIDAQMMALVSRRDDYKTSHVLHLLLSVFTLGLWVPVWVIVAISNGIERGKIDRALGKV